MVGVPLTGAMHLREELSVKASVSRGLHCPAKFPGATLWATASSNRRAEKIDKRSKNLIALQRVFGVYATELVVA